ncbi:DUF3618 domain-containing protein [Aurantimonas sp. 22II-16-19i]|uniref:DUF3618 domain-containing protein n=1 Tax=Aurantimonas sp. 22II-16-19i TaxID=1317114 RepID=UPI0009F7F232|nr:DUF3618 domain-containing protein [Aurantimonas sp. 22II-16-19i]ORE86462.1 hypothetical protein ATO4_26100 [Aurantimonas sp. 22II-16-19i]
MSAETDRLEKEAEAHRSDLDATLDAIKGKLSLGQIVDEVSQHFKQGQGAETARNLGRQVRDNPLALGMVGAGFAWLLLGNGARAHGSETVQRYERWREDRRYDRFDEAFPGEEDEHGPGLGERLSNAAHSVTGAASSMGSSAGSAAGRAGSSASNAGHASADSVRRGLHDARDAAGSGARSAYRGARSSGQGIAHGGQRAADFLSEQPFVAGALALGVGLAIASVFPRTRQEDDLFGDASDEMRERAKSEGREAFHKAEDVARRSFDAASEEADRQGLKPKSGDEAKPLAERVAAVGRAAEEAGRDEAKKGG